MLLAIIPITITEQEADRLYFQAVQWMVRVQLLCLNSPGKWYTVPQFRFFIFLNPSCNIYKFKKNSKRYTMRSQLICTTEPLSSEIGFTRNL